MRIAMITAGAAGMFCGSCLRDNSLVTALIEDGHDALLIPTFTPIKTDDEDVSEKRVFFGGINVYLQDKFALFRYLPRWMDRAFSARVLLRWISRFASNTNYASMGQLTVSMLQGEHGHQRKEVDRLIDWLEREIQPDVIILTNVLLSGMIPEMQARLGVPILATLQGDDIFLDALHEDDRKECLQLIRENTESVKGFIATSRYYADYMASYLDIDPERIHVIYPGINLKGHSPEHLVPQAPPYRIGYFARICPEKGFQNAIDAFIQLRETPGAPPCKLRASGWLGDNQRGFFEQQVQRLGAYGLSKDFEYVPAPDHASKVKFFKSIDVLTVPTLYREPKGLYLLEAWANSVPVVQPRHGAFTELIGLTGAGLLVEPGDPNALARALQELLENSALREEMGRRGRKFVEERFTAYQMARETTALIERLTKLTPNMVSA